MVSEMSLDSSSSEIEVSDQELNAEANINTADLSHEEFRISTLQCSAEVYCSAFRPVLNTHGFTQIAVGLVDGKIEIYQFQGVKADTTHQEHEQQKQAKQSKTNAGTNTNSDSDSDFHASLSSDSDIDFDSDASSIDSNPVIQDLHLYQAPILIASFHPHTSSVRSLIFDEAGNTIFSVSSDSSIASCRMDKVNDHLQSSTSIGPDIPSLPYEWKLDSAHSTGINCIALYRNCLLVTGDDDGHCKIFDLRILPDKIKEAKNKANPSKKNNNNNNNNNNSNNKNKSGKSSVHTNRTNQVQTKNGRALTAKEVKKKTALEAKLAHNSTEFTGYETFAFSDHGDYISCIFCDPLSQRFITAAGDGHIFVYKVQFSMKLGQTKVNYYASSECLKADLLSCCSIKQNSKLLIGDKSGELNMFSLKKQLFGYPTDHYTGHPESIDTILTIDDNYGIVLTGSSDGLIRLLRIHPNQLLGIIGQHEAGTSVDSLTLSPSFKLQLHELQQKCSLLASCSLGDKNIHFWDVSELVTGDWATEEEEKSSDGDSDDDSDRDSDDENSNSDLAEQKPAANKKQADAAESDMSEDEPVSDSDQKSSKSDHSDNQQPSSAVKSKSNTSTNTKAVPAASSRAAFVASIKSKIATERKRRLEAGIESEDSEVSQSVSDQESDAEEKSNKSSTHKQHQQQQQLYKASSKSNTNSASSTSIKSASNSNMMPAQQNKSKKLKTIGTSFFSGL